MWGRVRSSEAPEIADMKPCNLSVDIYSFGCMMCDIMTGERVFSEYRMSDQNVVVWDVSEL